RFSIGVSLGVIAFSVSRRSPGPIEAAGIVPQVVKRGGGGESELKLDDPKLLPRATSPPDPSVAVNWNWRVSVCSSGSAPSAPGDAPPPRPRPRAAGQEVLLFRALRAGVEAEQEGVDDVVLLVREPVGDRRRPRRCARARGAHPHARRLPGGRDRQPVDVFLR